MIMIMVDTNYEEVALMGRTYIESTNLETAQRLAMLILEKTDISTMSVEEVATQFIATTNTIFSKLDEEYK